MVAVSVMHCMATCPAVVRHEQQAVQAETQPTFNRAIGMEGVVAAFVGNHPATHGDGACDHRVNQPQRGGDELEGNLGPNPVSNER